MLDTNNREIRTGDFIRISGAYFNSANGVYLVTSDGQTPDRYGGNVWMHKVKKNGELCLNRAGTTCSLPMGYYCSDASKNRAAKEHDKINLRYEVVDDVPTFYAAEHFKEQAAKCAEVVEHKKRNGWHEEAEKAQVCVDYYTALAEKLAQSATPPKEKAPEHGVKFFMNGIKVDGGRLIPCWYSVYDGEVHISAKDYGGNLPREYFSVENDTDIYTDYFCKDHTTLTPEHPLYKYARYVALKNLVNGKDWHIPTEEQKAEFARMKDPGHPTQADYDAIEEMRIAAQNAKEAARRAEELAEREKILKIKSEGKHYIESVMEQHPLNDGEPIVTICWSEHPAFYAWEDDTLKMSVAAAEIILTHFDEERHEQNVKEDCVGYDKTKFRIDFVQDDGEQNFYEGRYDLGDNDGGLVEHIRAHGRWHRTHDEHNGREIENPPQELSDCEIFADWLEQYTENGRIVNVTVDENLLDLAIYRKQQEKAKLEQAKAEMQDLFDKVAMLTDEQIEAAVFAIDPNDKDKLDVARFFLQELARRDEDNALTVFRRWMQNG